MSFTVFNVRTELLKMSKGKKTKISAAHLAHALLDYVPANPKRSKVKREDDFLERLYRLEDPRDN